MLLNFSLDLNLLFPNSNRFYPLSTFLRDEILVMKFS